MSGAGPALTRNKRKSASSPKSASATEVKKSKLTPDTKSRKSTTQGASSLSQESLADLFPPTQDPSPPSSPVLTVPTPQEEVTFESQNAFGATMDSEANNGYDSSASANGGNEFLSLIHI